MSQIIRNSTDLKQALIDYNKEKGYGWTNSELEETLFWGLEQVYEETTDSHRWWNTTFNVAKLPFKYAENGYLLIGFYGAETTGDQSPHEIGWEFDWKSLHEVEPKEVTIGTYVKKENK